MNIAVVGASGAVGRELLSILETRNQLSIKKLKLFTSKKSAGKTILFGGKHLKFDELSDTETFEEFNLVFFTAGRAISEKFIPRVVSSGALSIDNSSYFRMHRDVPLVIPEINAHDLKHAAKGRIVANPNCTTAQMVMVLKPLHDAFELKRVLLTSFQAVSGRGQRGIEALQNELSSYINKGQLPRGSSDGFPHPIALNCIPQVDVFEENAFTGEEHKVMNETRKILGLPNLAVTATCVRVPVLNAHSESVAIETQTPMTLEKVRLALECFKGVRVIDDPSKNAYPLALDVSGKDEVCVGRLRLDPSVANNTGLLMWIVADNLRKGAALNAVQIAEKAVEMGIAR